MLKKLYILILLILSASLFSCNNEQTSSQTPTLDSTLDTTEDELNFTDSYYSYLNGKLDSNFKLKLHTLLEETHKVKISYKQAWDVLTLADEIEEGKVRCIYTNQAILAKDKSGSTSAKLRWNREHVWAKSHAIDNPNSYAYSDCHHLHACEETINSKRGNSDFMEVISGTTDSFGNKYTNNSFEPQDKVKGDIARSMLYMVVRYDGDLCDNCSLDLELVSGNTSSSSSNEGYFGDLETLIKWHYLDPVDDFEIKRNEIVYSYQKNRNPFIDHPEFVEYLYKDLAYKYANMA